MFKQPWMIAGGVVAAAGLGYLAWRLSRPDTRAADVHSDDKKRTEAAADVRTASSIAVSSPAAASTPAASAARVVEDGDGDGDGDGADGEDDSKSSRHHSNAHISSRLKCTVDTKTGRVTFDIPPVPASNAVPDPAALSFPGAYRRMLSSTTVYVIDSVERCDRAFAELARSEPNAHIVGFDCEWKPKGMKGGGGGGGENRVAIIQLTTRRMTLIIQIHKIGSVPDSLRAFLENRAILKTGVGCSHDAHKLSADWQIHTRGVVELGSVFTRSPLELASTGSGLKTMTQSVLGVELDKAFALRCGDWESTQLSTSQLLYAAADSYYSRKLFMIAARIRAIARFMHAPASPSSSSAADDSLRAALRAVDVGDTRITLTRDVRVAPSEELTAAAIASGSGDAKSAPPSAVIAITHVQSSAQSAAAIVALGGGATTPVNSADGSLAALIARNRAPPPPFPVIAALIAAAPKIKVVRADMSGWLLGLVDTSRPKPPRQQPSGSSSSSGGGGAAGDDSGSSDAAAARARRKLELGNAVKFSQSLYENCRMLGPDGTFMCTCDKAKVDWYLSRNLAEIVSQDPITIKLTFTPRGKGNAGNAYYEHGVKNCCVVCGATQSLLKHHIIPLFYRAHYPMKLKSHSSHDIVLLCGLCHQRTCTEYDRFREQLSLEIGVSAQPKQQLSDEQRYLRNIKSCAVALLRSGTAIPAARKAELERKLREHFRHEPTAQEVTALAALPENGLTAEESKTKSHGYLVVEKYKKTSGGLNELSRRWRQFFLDAVQPQHLSPHWQVDHQKPNDYRMYDAEWEEAEAAQAKAKAEAERNRALKTIQKLTAAGVVVTLTDEQLLDSLLQRQNALRDRLRRADQRFNSLTLGNNTHTAVATPTVPPNPMASGVSSSGLLDRKHSAAVSSSAPASTVVDPINSSYVSLKRLNLSGLADAVAIHTPLPLPSTRTSTPSATSSVAVSPPPLTFSPAALVALANNPTLRMYGRQRLSVSA